MKNKNIPDTLKDMKNDGVYVYNTDYTIYKNYFLNPPVTKFNNSDVSSTKIKTCSRDKLEKLLVSKYGLVKIKIQNKMNFLENYNINN
jgi:hypothetical protein